MVAPTMRQGPGFGTDVRRAIAAGAAVAAALLAGCSLAPKNDGPPEQAPPGAVAIPDAEPRIEPIKPGGANKPYEVLGQSYTPIARDAPLREKGIASWYGRKFHGRKTASGELYDMHAMTAAHKTMPLPSYARVRNPANGREVIVRVNDRGPFVAGRVIDLSYAAAVKLGVQRGIAPVELERITFDEIRSGAWRREGAGAAAAPAAAAVPAGTTAPQPEPTPPAVAQEVALAVPVAAAAPAAEASPAVSRAASNAARGWWVQLGAFRERSGAEGFRQRVAGELDWIAPLLALMDERPLWRLQAGPFPSRDDAQSAAQRLREALQLTPLIVERR
ncbi:MAG TPA: septal ring lytic transglycosylase RlpA family protein [Methylibium sp.]|uniref:septal ring lytic transglycosylase RlpA family protein n=1 Tax=Methylibium sp. TaxID=2067992 RepID=UPI002DB9E2F4|nr:septal ring lytic transglycosylase RlpA family protein [Methylibium sp.]HEU4460524.1 septal ring lytic transglycosylase RlpA family protein [Methylibium sp.]